MPAHDVAARVLGPDLPVLLVVGEPGPRTHLTWGLVGGGGEDEAVQRAGHDGRLPYRGAECRARVANVQALAGARTHRAEREAGGLRPYEPDPGHAGEGRGWTPMSSRTSDVLVIGGGIIGLVTAWRAAQRGFATAVVDPEPGGGAAQVAAGMLAAVTELHYGEHTLLGLNLASAHRYPDFAAELTDLTGLDLGYRRC